MNTYYSIFHKSIDSIEITEIQIKYTNSITFFKQNSMNSIVFVCIYERGSVCERYFFAFGCRSVCERWVCCCYCCTIFFYFFSFSLSEFLIRFVFVRFVQVCIVWSVRVSLNWKISYLSVQHASVYFFFSTSLKQKDMYSFSHIYHTLDSRLHCTILQCASFLWMFFHTSCALRTNTCKK